MVSYLIKTLTPIYTESQSYTGDTAITLDCIKLCISIVRKLVTIHFLVHYSLEQHT